MLENRRMLHIDSIRGVAALLVAYMHISGTFVRQFPSISANGTMLYDIANYLDFGRIGVIAFFAISGFVICNSLKGNRAQGSKKFLISRTFRLFPAFWVSLLGAVLVMYVLNGRPVNYDQVIANISMIPSVLGFAPVQGLYWTLEVELIFYLLCYLLFLCGGINKPVCLFLAIVLLMACYWWVLKHKPYGQYLADNLAPHWRILTLHLSIMFLGGLYRIYYDGQQKFTIVLGCRVPILVLVIAACGIIFYRSFQVLEQGIIRDSLIHFKQGISYLLGIALFFVGAQFIRIQGAVFVWLGKISYSLYLLHPVVFYFVVWLLRQYGSDYDHYHLSVYIVVCLLVSIALSSLVYWLVEKPCVQLSKQLTRMVNGTRATAEG